MRQLQRLSMLPAIHLNHPSNLIHKHLTLRPHKTSKFPLPSPDQLLLAIRLLTSRICRRSFPIISDNSSNSSSSRQCQGLSGPKLRPRKTFNILSRMVHPQAILHILPRQMAMFTVPQCRLHPAGYRRNRHRNRSCSPNLSPRFIHRNHTSRSRNHISIRSRLLIRARCRLALYSLSSRCPRPKTMENRNLRCRSKNEQTKPSTTLKRC